MARIKKPYANKQRYSTKPNVEWLNVLQAKHNGLSDTHTKSAGEKDVPRIKNGKVQSYLAQDEQDFHSESVPTPGAKFGRLSPKFTVYLTEED